MIVLANPPNSFGWVSLEYGRSVKDYTNPPVVFHTIFLLVCLCFVLRRALSYRNHWTYQ
jgi:hypothetical protein